MHSKHDAVIVGGGHNGLVAAILLERAGRSVLVLERREAVGGAAVSGSPWPGVDARVSRYAYLVSLFPAALRAELGLKTELRTRTVASHPPAGNGFDGLRGRLAARLGPTLLEPLRSRGQIRELLGEDAWLLEQPLSEQLELSFEDDLERGIALTDATIGTFAPAADPLLRQNRCFVYHVVGGPWNVPVGGMGALSDELERLARTAGAEIRTGAEVTCIDSDGRSAEVVCADGSRHRADHVLANVAPALLAGLRGEPAEDSPEGSQLKLNMLVRRLPRLRDASPELAFAGTFHVNEGYDQLRTAYEQAATGRIPELPPCEIYCHSLTDPTILSPGLRAAGAQTLTLFGLHMPARLFASAGQEAKQRAVQATLRSLNSVLAEPIEDCLWSDAEGAPCLEARTPPELEAELGMPGGHIFHRDLSWPFAESEDEVGMWGAETAVPNVWLCGAGARRGGGVSGIPGHNAARAVLGM
ncbi:MAG TPA: NAD(P)/FAD-dependent oxidoreductase [Solirubrobacteraceae bacterium]|nr:NAD(P)/FAD-dependent oxidoreductase [Solirubrobacteraceae bacterium]